MRLGSRRDYGHFLVGRHVAQQDEVLFPPIDHPQGIPQFERPTGNLGRGVRDLLGYRTTGRINPGSDGKIEHVRPLVGLGCATQQSLGGEGNLGGNGLCHAPKVLAKRGEPARCLLIHGFNVYTEPTVTARLALLASCLVACDPDQNLQTAEPEIVVEPATIDVDEVVLGTFEEFHALVRNDGRGTLRIESAAFQTGTPPDFELVSFPTELTSGEEGELVVRYTPDIEGQDWATLEIVNNQPGKENFPVTVTGFGVKPCIDIDPELLWFGTVAPGGALTKEFQVRAGCTGNLKIVEAQFPAAEGAAYALSLPDDWAVPYTLRTGFAFTASVTFRPPDTAEYRGELWFVSNDPETEVAAVQLEGNTIDDPDVNEAPVCEITEPDVGEYFLDDRLVTLVGSVFDQDEDVNNLLCAWFANSSKLADASMDETGTVANAENLPVGDVELELRCYDSNGASCSDSTTVKVWKHEDPIEYIITGGDSIFDYFGVDDDIAVTLDGAALFTDDNDTKDNLAPVVFEAKSGQVLHVQVVDQNTTEGAVDPLMLHWGTGISQSLNDAVCLSADPVHSCYDGTYNGPWPGVILDQSFTISIP